MKSTFYSDRLRSAIEYTRTDILELVDKFRDATGMADSSIARAVYGAHGDKDFIGRLRKGLHYSPEKIEPLERFLREGLKLEDVALEEFVEAARVKARLPTKSRPATPAG